MADNHVEGSLRRTTIHDIASKAGVSVASVSYALNGKPGVSDATRAHILKIAQENHWEPNHQARSLHRSTSDIVGLVIPASTEAISAETFWILFISGLEGELRRHGKSLLLHTEPDAQTELDIYRKWRNSGIVDAVVLTDLRRNDTRIEYLMEIGLPVVLAGKPSEDLGLSYCFASDSYDMEQLLHHLHGLGLRRIARVAGDADFLIVEERHQACTSFARDYDLEPVLTIDATFLPGDELGVAIEQWLSSKLCPEVIIADSDLLAMHVLHALTDRGVKVPEDMQVVSFDDSFLCQAVTPQLTAMDRRPAELGRAAGRLVVSGLEEQHILRIPPGRITQRGTTAPKG